jgi:type II secretory ATPase GspE/PulE/Tfp pilus assembly ATPase PilB-like protein
MKTNNPGVQIICGKTGDGISATLRNAAALTVTPRRIYVLEEPPEFELENLLGLEKTAKEINL